MLMLIRIRGISPMIMRIGIWLLVLPIVSGLSIVCSGIIIILIIVLRGNRAVLRGVILGSLVRDRVV